MQKKSKKLYLLLILCCFFSASNVFANFVFDSFLPQAVIYPMKGQQPLVGVRVTSLQWGGGKLWHVYFELSENTPIEMLRNFKVYSSNGAGFGTDATELNSVPLVQNGRRFTLDFAGAGPVLSAGNSLFLTAEVSPLTAPEMRFNGQCVGINIDGGGVTLNASKSEGARVYNHAYRIIPYYRFEWIMGWGNWTDDYMNLVTDIIYFHVGADANGNLSGQTNKTWIDGFEKLKAAKVNSGKDVQLLLGMAHCDGVMDGIVSDAIKRTRLADQLVALAVEKGFNGIDIDWEYPDNLTQWGNYGIFLYELKSKAYVHGLTISCAISPYANSAQPPATVLNLFDYVNLMSYDASGYHSTMATMTNDINWARSTGKLPNHKIISGLPFYSNETKNPRDWDKQQGYGGIISKYPELTDDDNIFIHEGNEHYFNGATLLKQKGARIKSEKIGGGMIWCYDGDLPLSNPRSAALNLSQELIQSPNYVYVKPALGENQVIQNGLTWETAFVGDAGMRSALTQTVSMVRIASGNYSFTSSLTVPANLYICGGYKEGQTESTPLAESQTVFIPTVTAGNAIKLEAGSVFDRIEIKGSGVTAGARAIETSSNVTIDRCYLHGVRSDNQIGAAIYINGANSILKRSRIENNQSSSTANDGGVVYLGVFKVDIDGCYFIDNVYTGPSGTGVWARGGCIYSQGGAAANFTITNSLFKNNRLSSVGAGAHGGAICFQNNTTPNRVINCTFIGNQAQSVSCIHNLNVLQNCVFYNNAGSINGIGKIGEIQNNALAGSLGTESIDITGKTEDSLFTNAAINDYTPSVGSVLLNTGTNSIWKKQNKDILDERRLNGIVDIGAFESQILTLTNLSGTGSGVYNAGDMVTITTQIPEGKLLQWIVTGSSIVLPNEAPVTFAMPNESFTVKAQYRWIIGDTEDNPVLITNETELINTNYQIDRYCKIANDFSLSSTYSPPVFKGFIDGDQKVITLPADVTINSSLFGAPTDNPKIKNIVYKVDGTIQQDGSAGGFLKQGGSSNSAEIKKCTLILNGAIYGTDNAGGFVGDVWGNASFKIFESTLYLRGTIATSSSLDGMGSGGVFGKLNATSGNSCVKNCNIVIYNTGKITTNGGAAQVGDLIGRYNQGDHANNIVAKENSITIGDKGNVTSRFKFNQSNTLTKWDAGVNLVVSGTPPIGALENNLFTYEGTTLKSHTSSPIGSSDVSIVYTPTTVDGYLAPPFKINYQVDVQRFMPIFTPVSHIDYVTGDLYNSKLLASPVGADGMEIAGNWDWNSNTNEAVSGDKVATFTPETDDYNSVSQTISVKVITKPYLKLSISKTQVEAHESYDLVISAIISPNDALEVKYTKDGVEQTVSLLSNQTEVRISQKGASSTIGTITHYELIANGELYEINKSANLAEIQVYADVVATDTRYVTQSGAGDKRGRNWLNAAPKENLQDLLNATDVMEVYLGAGTYVSSIGSGTKSEIASAFKLPKNKTLVGGFPLDGGDAWSVENETLLNRQSTSMYSRILYMESGSTLKGVTISGGNVTIVGGGTVNGCGVYAETNTKILSSLIKDNRGSASLSGWDGTLFQGGGIYAAGAITLRNVTVNNNDLTIYSTVGGYAEALGAGVFCKSDAIIENCQIISNLHSTTISGNASDEKSIAFGGGIYFEAGNASIENSIFQGNRCITVLNGNTAGARSFAQGGSIYLAEKANVAISNTIITLSSIQSTGGSNHSVKAQGSGLYVNGKAKVIRTSVLRNSSNKEGGGVYDNMAQVEVANSIIWKNSATTYPQTNVSSNRLIHSAIQSNNDDFASDFIEGSNSSFYLHSRNEHQFGPRLKKIDSDNVALSDEEIDLRCLLSEKSVLINRGMRGTK